MNSSGGLIGGLYKADADASLSSSIRKYVNVVDLEATLAATRAAGGSVITPRTEIGGDMGWWAELADPDGRRLGLCTSAPRAADVRTAWARAPRSAGVPGMAAAH